MIILTELPDYPLLHILSLLDCGDLLSCCCTCRRLHQLGTVDILWKKHCQYYWLIESCPEGQGWYSTFREWYQKWGRYAHVYRHIRKAWNQIEAFIKDHCPQLILQQGLSEDDLSQAEDKLDYSLPLDLRCSLRLHDGQLMYPGSSGLLGMIPDDHSNVVDEFLPSLESAITQIDVLGPEERGAMMITALGLTFPVNVKTAGHFLALTDEFGFEPGQVYYPIPRYDDRQSEYSDSDQNYAMDLHTSNTESDDFISANSFQEFLCTHAQNLESKHYLKVLDGTFHRFYYEPSCVAYTGHISVRVATCFQPDYSRLNPYTQFFYAYRITMAMSPDAPESESCILQTRHWTITDADGNEEKVEGDGVVGTYPEMTPGKEYSWESSTSFKTSYGTMHGYFTMLKFNDETTFQVKCPVFHMKCLPYITHEEKEHKIQLLKKNK